MTELRQDCAAIIGWYHLLFIADDVTAFSGDVPPDVMRTLNAKVFAEYVTAVGKEYANSLEMLAEMRDELMRREIDGSL